MRLASAAICLSLLALPARGETIGDWTLSGTLAFTMADDRSSSLVIACIAERPALVFVTHRIRFNKEPHGVIKYSVDGLPIKETRWLQTDDLRGFHTFSLSIVGSGKSLSLTAPRNYTASFHIDGAQRAVSLVKARCGGDPA